MSLSTHGCPLSVTAFPPAVWSGRHKPGDFAAERYCYPGARPSGSFILSDGIVHGLDPASGGWVDRDTATSVDIRDRVLVLAYGSNADVVKLAANLKKLPDRRVLGLRCLVIGHAAVWCNARRQRDASVVATIAADPGRVEVHHVLAVTKAQLEAVDRWEGVASLYYERQTWSGRVVLENGTTPSSVEVYVGTADKRPPFRRDGYHLRVAEHSYAEVDALVGPR